MKILTGTGAARPRIAGFIEIGAARSRLIAKEIRLLLPALCAALLLAVVPVWLLTKLSSRLADITVYPFWFGVMMLALSSFGREFGLHTFPLLLSQPLERTRIWWTKITVLAIALATAYAAWFVSCHFFITVERVSEIISDTLPLSSLGVVVTFASGLWTTLLFRQVAGAFWFSFLVPQVLQLVVLLCGGGGWIINIVLGLYSVIGFWFAWWLFERAQDIAWTGGVVRLPGFARAEAKPLTPARKHRPFRALLYKEIQLHQVVLAGMASLLALHILVLLLPRTGHITETTGSWGKPSGAQVILLLFGVIWMLVPLLTGTMSIAEERKLGTIQEQLCLPICRRIQFLTKLLFVLMVGGLLSPFLLWVLEGVGIRAGAAPIFAQTANDVAWSDLALRILLALALALIGFYASTLTRNLIQALAAAVAVTAGIWGGLALANHPAVWGNTYWPHTLLFFIALPTLTVMIIWLAYRNFRQVTVGSALGRRNLFGFAGATAFILLTTAGIYQRAWEFVTPREPDHAPAVLTQDKIKVHSGGNALTTILPDGKLWIDRLEYNPGRVLAVLGGYGFFAGGKWQSVSATQFVPGSNWVNAMANFRETVAIKADGTLWVSAKPRDVKGWENENLHGPQIERYADLIRYGDEANWQSLVRGWYWPSSALLLKQDGTLWIWGTNTFKSKMEWPGLRSFKPYRVGSDSDWARLLTLKERGITYGWKKDGTAWILYASRPSKSQNTGGVAELIRSERFPSLDHTQWRSVVWYPNFQRVGVREDGTLWAWDADSPYGTTTSREFQANLVQVGRDTDWVKVERAFNTLVGLKADGSLWKWEFRKDIWRGASQLATQSPTRMSRHNDWIALGNIMDGIVSLAADGTLWYWWSGNYSHQPLLRPSRKPDKIENVFGQQQPNRPR